MAPGFHVYLFNWRLQVQWTSEVTHIRRHNSLKVPHWKGKQDVRARITSFFYRRVSNEMRAQDKVGGWWPRIWTQPSLLTHQLQLPITSTHSDCLSNQYFLLNQNKTERKNKFHHKISKNRQNKGWTKGWAGITGQWGKGRQLLHNLDQCSPSRKQLFQKRWETRKHHCLE